MLNVCLRNKDNNDCYDYGCASKPTDQCGPVLHMDQSPDYFDCPESENTSCKWLPVLLMYICFATASFALP